MKNIGIFLKDGEEDDEEDEKENEPTPTPILGRGKRTAVLDSKLRVTREYPYYVLFVPILSVLIQFSLSQQPLYSSSSEIPNAQLNGLISYVCCSARFVGRGKEEAASERVGRAVERGSQAKIGSAVRRQ